MHVASRESLTALSQRLDVAIGDDNVAVTQAAQTDSELLGIVEVLDFDRGLRVAVTDTSATVEQRSGLVRSLFMGRVSKMTPNFVVDAAVQVWPTPREMHEGLVELGRRTLLRSTEGQGQLETAESKLLQLGRTLTEQLQLEQLLADKVVTPEAKRGLFVSTLYGKVTFVTEALALQAIGRLFKCPADNINSLSRLTAGLRNHAVARMTGATVTSDEQEWVLADKLSRVYGKVMSIHTVTDRSILGRSAIQASDEVIDGSLSTKLKKLRADLG